MQPHRQTWRQSLYLNQEEHHEDQEQGFEGLEGDARDVSKEQEALQEDVPSKKPSGDRGINRQEEVQSYTLFEEKKRPEERAETQGADLQPVDNRQITRPIQVTCQSPPLGPLLTECRNESHNT